jgi:hypothetical protein
MCRAGRRACSSSAFGEHSRPVDSDDVEDGESCKGGSSARVGKSSCRRSRADDIGAGYSGPAGHGGVADRQRVIGKPGVVCLD